jgi:ABC-type spermidine/putrescine transport system permease subunit I
MILNNISLVNWGMGAAIIGVFAVVCVALVLIVLNMMNSDKKKE